MKGTRQVFLSHGARKVQNVENLQTCLTKFCIKEGTMEDNF